MGKDTAVARVLDCSGSHCPEPVLRTRRAITGMAGGDIIEVTATDPLAELDLVVYCEHAGHELLHAETVDGIVRVRIRVRSAPRPGDG
jgi:tRNA 2-thiouridine synthesizing protein A